ncbi:D-ribose ABC transporter substrate-binding protein [Treponema phagedenis]|uniref:D-ribose ABC transporter substrate-binding protein n=1 Tax=Treponema phagedenis TaxID=162 RepID=A0AAE6M819_TREPH|nr:D-ribose ABC transporter substrate-binding protein [Treponema phagedenis]EFW37902.1 sugar-binding domain protein [Treponema phagedenis F0421]NVP22738.1 D-ribose ABC transporter substrate-binding protein [Treponema phagedenis]QEJ98415.1 D-ribose ABC transporter substrate-binding protein [Treponema phagedenis]QEK01163.1 D-ribose ABC transporter substrate-binding protein [Treponema phagedenis]QEK03923.1 D-ribose ABC transporter substrate-binding protein [Treponema phagedenis]
MKKILASLMLGAMIIASSFAMGGGENASSVTVGLSVSTLNNPFFVTLVDGAKAEAKSAGINLIVVDAGDDVAKQTNSIEDMISKKVQVLIVNPVDSDAVAPAVNDAIKAGIPVIAVDRAVNGANVTCTIASDNVQGAELATQYLVELVGKGSKVAELQGILGASATVDRGKGFHNVADKELKVVAQQTANFNRSEGLSVAENILQANGDIKGIFAHNDEMALGAIEAAASAKKNIVIVGFDATDDAIAAIKSGKMAATVAQKPGLMGQTAVQTAISILKKESIPAKIPVNVELVKKM